MKLRSLLLAGTVLPLTMSYPALALDRAPSNAIPWRLAQVEQACPEGEVCPPVEGQPSAPESPTPGMEVTPRPEGEGTIIEQLPAEQQTPEMEITVPEGEGTIIEQLPAEQPPPPSDIEITTPPEGEQTLIEPAPPDQPPTETEVATPPVEESTVEQQLERQGDGEEAGRVRSLRTRLLQQLEEVLVPSPGEPQDRRQRRRGYQNRYDEGDVVERRGDSVIIDLGGGNIHVEPSVPDDGGRLLYGADNTEVQQLENGRTRTTVYRRNGVRIITARDRYGEIIRRVKRLPDGRQIVLIDNRFPDGYDPQQPPILRDVPQPRVLIPEDQYIVDLGGASYDDLKGALLAPPVEPMQRPYTLDEVLRNERVRSYSPRIDLDTITFDFGSATIGSDQMRSLVELGRALEDVIAEYPGEVYLIEGHTDLVGGDYDNLILSDHRAEAVAVALSQNFDIPPENLITEGYGEQYPKVYTEAPERLNRRAAVRRVTELLQAQN